MKVKINGQNETLSVSQLTISDLLKLKNVEMPEMVSVEHNGSILEREAFASTAVNEADDMEFLYFMGGGSQASY